VGFLSESHFTVHPYAAKPGTGTSRKIEIAFLNETGVLDMRALHCLEIRGGQSNTHIGPEGVVIYTCVGLSFDGFAVWQCLTAELQG
jgi:hypothetical protein